MNAALSASKRSTTSKPFAPAPLILAMAAALFALMAVVAKGASATLPGPEAAFVRFCVGLVVCALAATRIAMSTKNRVGLFLRGVYGGAAVLCYFWPSRTFRSAWPRCSTIPPRFSPPFLRRCFWGSDQRGHAGRAAITTLGVALVMRGNAPPGSLGLGVWQVVGIGSAMFSGRRSPPSVRCVKYRWLVGDLRRVLLGRGGHHLDPDAAAWVTPPPVEWASLAVVGLISVAAQFLMTYSLSFVRAAIAGVIAQLTPVAAIALGWLWFDERIAGLSLVGAALTFAGVSWGAYLASAPQVIPEEP